MRSWKNLREYNNKLYFFQWYQLPHSFCLFSSQSLAGSLKQHHRKQTMQFNSLVTIFARDQSMQTSQRT